jgi:multidrug efflux pump subunit AcrB/ABC-type multidrug transport system ATPase subunit
MISFIIRRPVLVSMITVGLCLLGVVSYTRLPVELIPYAELPMLIVQVVGARDADPAYIEQQGVVPIESAIAGLEGIERIESYVDRRRTMIFVYYNPDTDLKFAYLKLQQCVATARAALGEGFFAMVWKIDTEQLANQFMTLQARGEGDLDQIREVLDRKVIPALEAIDGIANVEVYGGRRRSVEVVLNEEALQACNLTPAQVAAKLSQGSNARQYLGQVIDGPREYYVNLVAEYFSVAQLEETIVKDEGPILLKHVATIVDGGAEEESIARINGLESITISLIRDQQINLLSLSHQTRDVIERLNEQIAGDGLALVIQDDSAEVIENNIDIIKSLALVGGILAIVVLWIFLRNLSLVLIVAMAIPISVLIALNFFYAAEVSINTLTLVGLAIAIGMLLDNSVVVLENIHRLLGRGKSVHEAVVTGTGEVGRAIVAATLTTVCVFAPFVFSDNFLVQTLGRHIGVSIISTLLVSLAVAFILIPVSANYVLSRRPDSSIASISALSRNNRLLQIYTLLLKSCLRFPARTVIIGLTVFFLSVIICLAVSINVPEEVELNRFNLYATMPSGTTLESADEQVREMDNRLEEIAEVAERLANISEDDVTLTFTLADDYEDLAGRDLGTIKTDIYDKLSTAFPRVDFSYDEPAANVRYRGGGGGGMGGGVGRAFGRLLGIGTSEERVIVRGQDLNILRAIADDIKFNIDQLQTVSRSSLNVSESQPGIDLVFDKAALSHFNVTTQAITAELSSFQDEFSSGVTMKQGAEEIEVILKSDNSADRTADDLRELVVPTAAGGTMPLLQLARMVYTDGYSSIYRENQEKQVEVIFSFGADVTESSQLLAGARVQIEQIVDGIAPPPGVAIEIAYDETDLSDFYFLIFAAVILIYMILASVFESLITPLAMMFTIPLATVGAFLGLILTGNSVLNANVLVGFLILLGVVVNNGIILIDYSRLLRRRNFRPARALITAGQARVRPILITAITTVLGMLPLAMGKVEYVARIGAPFAITVIGGLIAGTLFTLIVVPTVSFGIGNTLAWWYKLDWKTKIVQFGALAGGFWLIYENIDSLLWRGANATALVLAVPALTYFIQVSLRRSSATVIPAGEPITITVRNVVKIYDDYSRFVREWRKGERQHARRLRNGIVKKHLGPIHQLWQLPLYIFHFYYTFIYVSGGFWVFVFSVGFYLYTLHLARPLLLPPEKAAGAERHRRLRAAAFRVIYWGGPLAILVWYQLQWDNPILVAAIGATWYLAVATYNTSQRLYRDKVDINRITGRFKRVRKTFYRLVKITPLIGKKKVPFRALHGVSMEIESGMFGLVGPNGAGKTTLMRVICGILRQSQGTVRFNDIDLDRQREELQSLIGYLPQEFGTYDNMSAFRFLDYQAILKGMWDPEQRRDAVERAIAGVHLGENRDIRIKAFSGGMKQRVGIAQTLLHLPRVLVVDEPTAGLDPRERIRFRNLLSGLARERIVIFSTHIIEDVSSSCNRLAVLDDGKVKFLGSPREMVDATRGCVWQAKIDEENFGNFRKTGWVVHHMWDGGRIRVRVLAANKPLPEAIAVTPTLEDSYMWLLGREKRPGADKGPDHVDIPQH